MRFIFIMDNLLKWTGRVFEVAQFFFLLLINSNFIRSSKGHNPKTHGVYKKSTKLGRRTQIKEILEN
jgi:hypothetical protein